jgi:hypothetical protein
MKKAGMKEIRAVGVEASENSTRVMSPSACRQPSALHLGAMEPSEDSRDDNITTTKSLPPCLGVSSHLIPLYT